MSNHRSLRRCLRALASSIHGRAFQRFLGFVILPGFGVSTAWATLVHLDTDNDGLPNAWETDQGLNPNDASDAALDGEGDGLTPTMEYGLGGSTTTNDEGLLPELVLVETADGLRARLTFERRQDDPLFTVIPELSTDPAPTSGWSAEALELVGIPTAIPGGFEEVVYQSVEIIAPDEVQFLRARFRAALKILASGLGNASEITSPAFGVGGTTALVPGDFGPGRTGDAADVLTEGKVIQFPVTGIGGTNLNLDQGEFEFWFRPTSDSDENTFAEVLFSLGNYDDGPMLVLEKTDRLSFYVSTDSDAAEVHSAPGLTLWSANEWVHIRATWDNASVDDSLQVFLDGKRISAGGATGGWSLEDGGTPSHFWIGSADGAGLENASGRFDEFVVRDYRQAWSDTNRAPLLRPMLTHWVVEGSTLNFTPVASDPDGDDLTFSLEPGAPAGASIDPTTGAFSLPTLPGDAPAVHEFCLRVIDDGTPRMSDTAKVVIGVAGNHPPVVGTITPTSQAISPGDDALVAVDWSDVDADIALVHLTIDNVIQSVASEAPYMLFDIKGSSGTTMVDLDTSKMPFGVTTCTITLEDSQGNMSNVGNFTIDVVGAGTGSSTPSVSIFSRFDSQVTQPYGPLDAVFPNFRVRLIDTDDDLERIRLTITEPGSSAATYEIPYNSIKDVTEVGTFRDFTLRPLKLTNESPLGSYQLSLIAIDVDGNGSAPRNTSFSVTGLNFFSYKTPRITDLVPASGPWGTEVDLDGLFPKPTEETLTVFINELECPVEHINNNVSVTIPDGARTGPLIMNGSRGTAVCSPTVFTVDDQVRIQPLMPLEFDEAGDPVPKADLTISGGESLALEAITSRLPRDGGSGTWFVEGIEGGSATVGTITKNGVFTAPPAAPDSFEVQVSAQLEADPSVEDDLIIVVRPAPIPPGGGLVRVASGGQLISVDGLTALSIPAGALAVETEITLRTLEPSEMPAPNPGMRILGGAQFGPSGLSFLVPAYGYIPLQRNLPMGDPVTIRNYDPVTMTYDPTPIVGTVTDDGLFAEFLLNHFSVYVAEESEVYSDAPAVPPTITGVSTTSTGTVSSTFSGEEGMRFPLFLSGTDFFRDLQVHFLNAAPDDTVAEGISHDTLIVSDDGTQAGFTIYLEPDTSLADSATRDYRIVLDRPSIGSDEVTFSVTGLGELILPSHHTELWNNRSPERYSTVVVPSTSQIRIESGTLDIETTGPIVVDGLIDASGAHGDDGEFSAGGVAQVTGGAGGQAVLAFPSKDPVFGFIIDRNVEDFNHGQDGNFVTVVDDATRGAGGQAGVSVKFDLKTLYDRIVSCAETLGFDCVRLAAEIINVANQVEDIVSGNISGKFGAGGAPFDPARPLGHGGGGGGGSGSFRVEIAVPMPFPLEDVGYYIESRGGGGGAGGDGGRSVRLVSESYVRVDGMVTTAGGDGGDGANQNRLEAGMLNPIPLMDDIVLNTGLDFDCFVGAGAGGGSAGVLVLKGDQGVFAPLSKIDYAGGLGGTGGIADVDPAAEVSRWGDTRRISSRGHTYRASYKGPLFNGEFLRPHATDRFILPLDGISGQLLFAGASRVLRTSVTVYFDPAEGGGFRIFDALLDNADRSYNGYAVLKNGFNRVVGGGIDEILILCIAVDSDNDGLSDADEELFGTDPEDPDTDDDGLRDGDEFANNADPLNPDTDGDGLLDGPEVHTHSTDPADFDSDDDEVSDGAEIVLGSGANDNFDTPEGIAPGTLLVAVSNDHSAGRRLGVVDLDTNTLGILGHPASGFGYGMAFDAFGDLYVLSGGLLSIYDPLGEESDTIGSLSGGVFGGPLAFNPSDGMLYSVLLGPSPDFLNTGQLLRIDPATAATTLVGAPQPTPIHSLAFSYDGRLYALVEEPLFGDALIELDPLTGVKIGLTVEQTAKTPLYGLAFMRDERLIASQPLSGPSGELWQLHRGAAAPTSLLEAVWDTFDLTVAPCPLPCLSYFDGFSASGGPVLDLRFGNFNGDAHLDLAKLQTDFVNGRTSVQLLKGNGSGGFTVIAGFVMPWTASGSYPRHLAVGDLNGDGIDDVAAANSRGIGQTFVTISTLDVDDKYDTHIASVIAHSNPSHWVGIASMNQFIDADLDLVIATDTEILVMFGDGTGTNYPTTVSISWAPEEHQNAFLDLGDLDGNTAPDIVAPGALVFNSGSGIFGAVQTFDTEIEEGEPTEIKLADVDGDSDLDLALTSLLWEWEEDEDSGELRVFLNNGSGTFAAPFTHGHRSTGEGSDAIASHDFDGNGSEDLIAGAYEGGYYVFIRAGTADPAMILLENDEIDWGGVYCIDIGDVDGDEKPEIVTGDDFANAVIFYQTGNPFRE